MGKLDNAITYLSGSMEFAKDGGIGWRQEFIKKLKDNNLNIKCIDPCNKPGGHGGNIEEKSKITRLKEEEKWEELQDYVHTFRRADLRYTDLADFLVVAIDPKLHLCGTYNELFLCETQRKPIFCIIDGGLKNLPVWLFDVFDLNNVFSSIDECVQRLIDLDSEKLPMNDKWVLIRKFI